MRKIRRQFETAMYEFIPITPIHIGSGNEMYPDSYVVKDKKFYKIGMTEIFDKLSEKKREQFERVIQKGMVDFRTFLNEIYEENLGYIYKVEVDGEFSDLYNKKLKGTESQNEENQLIVKEFIESYAGKYIPGSSIKGAIRTAFLSEFGKEIISYRLGRKNSRTAPFVSLEENGREMGKREADKKSKKLEAKILGLKELEPKIDPFKNLLISDTTPLKDMLKVIKVERFSKKGKRSVSNVIEATESLLTSDKEISLKFRLSVKNFSSGVFKEIKELDEKIDEELDIDEDILFERLRERAKRIIENELKFFREAKNKDGENYCKEIEKMISKLEDDEAMIKIGYGSGFNAMTFNLENKKYNEKRNNPVTKLVYKGCPLGWALIRKIRE